MSPPRTRTDAERYQWLLSKLMHVWNHNQFGWTMNEVIPAGDGVNVDLDLIPAIDLQMDAEDHACLVTDLEWRVKRAEYEEGR